MLNLDESAPAFCAEDDTGRTTTLRDFIGTHLVLYFYPKDWSTGCTKQALEFKRLHSAFVSLNAVIVGVSRDDVRTHHEFRVKLGLPFMLISDPKRRIHEAYGVLRMKTVHGNPSIAVQRSTFVVGPDGILEAEFRGVSPERHPAELLGLLRSLRDSKRTFSAEKESV